MNSIKKLLIPFLLAMFATAAFAQTPVSITKQTFRVYYDISGTPQFEIPGGSSPIDLNCHLDLRVEATGSDLQYQWVKDGIDIPGATSATFYKVPTVLGDAGVYYCRVSNTISSVNSNAANIVTVDIQPLKVLSPLSATATAKLVCIFQAPSSSTVRFRWKYQVGAVPASSDPPVPANAFFSGTKTSVLSIKTKDVAVARKYYCQIITHGYFMEACPRDLILVPPPANHLVQEGGNATFMISPVAPGVHPAYTYQWLKGGVPVPGENGPTYTVTNAMAADDGPLYSCIVDAPGLADGNTATPGTDVTSDPGDLTVVTAASGLALTSVGAATVSLQVPSTGTGHLFQWFRNNVALTNGAKYTGATTTKLGIKLPDTSDADVYECRATAFGDTVVAGTVKLIVLPAPASQAVAVGDPFTLELMPEGLMGMDTSTWTFQWFKGTAAIAGATGITYTDASAATTDAGDYICQVTVPGVGTAKAPKTAVVVVTTTPASQLALTANTGGRTIKIKSVLVAGKGNTFQWLKKDGMVETPLANGAKYAGATTKQLSVLLPDLTDGGEYICRITSGSTTVDIPRTLVMIQGPLSMLVDLGSLLNLDVVTQGEPAPLTFQWFKGTTAIAGEINSTLSFASVALTDAATYVCQVTLAGTGSLKTKGAKIAVVNVEPLKLLALTGSTPRLGVTTAGSGLTYKWYRVDGGDTLLMDDLVNYKGAASKSLSILAADLADGGTYRCEVIAYGRTAVVGIRRLVMVQSPQSGLQAVGSSLTLQILSNGAAEPLGYQWRKKKVNIGGETNMTFNINPIALTDASDYDCVVSCTGAASITTAAAKIAVVDTTPVTVPVYETFSAKLPTTTAGTGITFQWQKNMVNLTNASPFSGVTTKTLLINPVAAAQEGDYVCQVTANMVTIPVTVTLGVSRAPIIGAINFPDAIVGGDFSYQVPFDPDPLRVPTKFAASGLPTGLSINSTTGLVTGKPQASGSFAVTFTISNPAGSSSSPAELLIVATLPAYISGSYVAPILRQTGIENGGKFQMTVTGSGLFTGKLTMNAIAYTVTGYLNVIGTDNTTATANASFTVIRKGLSNVDVSFDIGTDNYLVNGELDDGTNIMNFNGWRNSFSAGAPPTAYTGTYNFGMGLAPASPVLDDPAFPQGVGYGQFFVLGTGTNAGVVNFVGKNSLDESLIESTVLGPDGELMMYVPLKKATNLGSIVGTMTIDDLGNADPNDNTLAGTVSMSQPMAAKATHRLYKAGFAAHDLAVEGGTYPGTANLLGLSVSDEISLAFEQGGLAAADRNPDANFTVAAGTGKPVITAANIAGTKFTSVAPATGLFAGGFTLKDDNPTTPTVNPDEMSRAVTFKGLVFLSGGQLVGAGYFILAQIPTGAETPTTSPQLSGRFALDPVP